MLTECYGGVEWQCGIGSNHRINTCSRGFGCLWLTQLLIHLSFSLISDICCVSLCVCVQGVSLAQAKDKGQLIFLEGLNESLSVLLPQESNTGSGAMDFLRYQQMLFFTFLLYLYINESNFVKHFSHNTAAQSASHNCWQNSKFNSQYRFKILF